MKKPLCTRDAFFLGVVEYWRTGVMGNSKKKPDTG
jgi:hypothetical protein